MTTDLNDPYFCPPRQLRQGQGRGSVYEINSGLRFKPGKKRGDNSSATPPDSNGSKSPTTLVRGSVSLDPTHSAESEYDNLHSTPATSECETESDCSNATTIVNAFAKSSSSHEKCPSWPASAKSPYEPYVSNRISEERKRQEDSQAPWMWDNGEQLSQKLDKFSPSRGKKPSLQDSGIALPTQDEDSFSPPMENRAWFGQSGGKPPSSVSSSSSPGRGGRGSGGEAEGDHVWFGSDRGRLLLQEGNGVEGKRRVSEEEEGTSVGEGSEEGRQRDSVDSDDTNTSFIHSSFSSSTPLPLTPSFLPPPPSTHDYDSDTLRRAAAKNREVSKKLFKQYREQQLHRGSPRHERQSSSVLLLSGERPHRGITKSPSQVSSGGGSSIYTDSSSSSSGIGTLTSSRGTPRHKDSLTRSVSMDVLAAANSPQPRATWNTPQQRRNILSMVMVDDGKTDYVVLGQSEGQKGGADAFPARVADRSDVGKSSSYAASRGVSRKISSRRRAAKESFNHHSPSSQSQHSLPDLSSSTGDQSLPIDDGGFYSVANDPKVCLSRRTSDFEGSYSEEIASPIYAIPHKWGKEGGVDILQSMKSPPPLPSKPPPPLYHLDSRPISYQFNSTSTPCLTTESHFDGMSERSRPPVAPPRPSKELPAPPPYKPSIWPKSAESKRVVSPEPHTASFGIPASKPAAGKPTVQVHPMMMGENSNGLLTVTVDQTLSPVKKPPPIGFGGTPGGTSPRPPVPKKPDFLSPPKGKGFLPHHPPPTTAPHPHSTPQPHSTPHQHSADINFRSCNGQQNNSFDRQVEEKCNRLSALISQGDERLRKILLPPPVLEELPHTPHHDSSPTQHSLLNQTNDSISPESPYYTTSTSKAKFLVGIYSRGSTPISAKHDRDSVDGADVDEMERKKRDLVQSLSRKVRILEEERRAIAEEFQVNEKLGESIMEVLQAQNISEYEYHKVRRLTEDTENVTCLLLKLYGQLARVDNATARLLPTAPPMEKKLLIERRERLESQLEDANCLKTSLDERYDQVVVMLERYFESEPEKITDFKYFLQMKIKLQTDAREIEDKLKMGEEQKEALENSLQHTNTFAPIQQQQQQHTQQAVHT